MKFISEIFLEAKFGFTKSKRLVKKFKKREESLRKKWRSASGFKNREEALKSDLSRATNTPKKKELVNKMQKLQTKQSKIFSNRDPLDAIIKKG